MIEKKEFYLAKDGSFARVATRQGRSLRTRTIKDCPFFLVTNDGSFDQVVLFE